MSRVRNYVFTLNADEDKGEHIMWVSPGIDCPVRDWMDCGKIDYLVCQVERVAHVHVQGYVQFSCQMRMGALKKLCSRAHWEARRGTHSEAKAYCTKAESRINGPWEIGKEKGDQGARNDLRSLYADVLADKTNKEMLDSTEGTAARYEKQLRFMRFVNFEARSDRQLQGVRVLCLYGPTGSGKTYAAVNYIAGGKDYYIAEAPSKRGDKLWFDGYEGQRCLILDDFDGDYCTMGYLKRLLDCYKLKVEVKGGFSWAVWTTVVITSNTHPSAWFKKADAAVNMGPLARRIQEIRYCEHQGAYKRMDWDEQPLDADYVSYVVPAGDAAVAAVVTTPIQCDESSPDVDA